MHLLADTHSAENCLHSRLIMFDRLLGLIGDHETLRVQLIMKSNSIVARALVAILGVARSRSLNQTLNLIKVFMHFRWRYCIYYTADYLHSLEGNPCCLMML